MKRSPMSKRKIVKWSAVVLAVLSALVAVALVVLPRVFDHERLAAFASGKLQQYVAREVAIGRLSLELLPQPALRARSVTIANPSWASDKNFLVADDVALRFAWRSLLRGALRVDSARVSGVELNLETASGGRANWREIARPRAAGDPTAAGGATDGGGRNGRADQGREPDRSGNGAALDAAMALRVLAVSDLRVAFREQDGAPGNDGSGPTGAGPARWRIEKLDATAGAGWRDVDALARVERAGHALEASVRFDSLAQIGQASAVSQGDVSVSWEGGKLTLAGKLPLGLADAGAMAGSADAGKARAVVVAGSAASPSPSRPVAAPSAHAAVASASASASADSGTAFKLALEATSLTAPIGFLQPGKETALAAMAPLKIAADIAHHDGQLDVGALVASLGAQSLTGSVRLSRRGKRPVFEASIRSEKIDWGQATRDAGRQPPPPVPPGKVFYIHPFAWPALAALDGSDGRLDVQIASFRTRTGIELTNLKADMRSHDDRLDIERFDFGAFGGSAGGRLRLEGARRHARLELKARAISLQQWFALKTGKSLLSGGAMQVDARVSATGASMKDLAATLSGPVEIRIGNARVLSDKAGKAESLLTDVFPFFSEKSAESIDLACIAGRLPFSNGVATATPLAGARSSASRLLTRGTLDLRAQTVDLRGRIRPQTGIHLGIATLAGNVKITGPLRKPKMELDPVGTPGALARLGAAIVTGGLSIVATAAWDATVQGDDPCAEVFETRSRKR